VRKKRRNSFRERRRRRSENLVLDVVPMRKRSFPREVA
jgi:hypothetical protein